MALTDTVVRNAKPKDNKPYRLFDGGGLYVEVAPNGGKWWRFKFRFGGKEKRLSLTGKRDQLLMRAVRTTQREDDCTDYTNRTVVCLFVTFAIGWLHRGSSNRIASCADLPPRSTL